MPDTAIGQTDDTHIRHEKPEHAQTVLVDWMLGNSCNFSCSYCPSSLHDGSVRWQTEEAVISLYDQLRAHYVDGFGRRVWIQFTGGEPTMHPRIVPLLQAASARGFAVSLISNGSRTPRFWAKIRDHLDSVILTYHAEFADHAHFVETGGFLVAAMPVHVNVTMPPDRFDEVLDRARDIAAEMPGATISLKPLRVDFDSQLYDYSSVQIRQMQDGVPTATRADGTTPRGRMLASGLDGVAVPVRANEFILRDRNRWRGYACEAGLESLRVKGDGGIFRAVCGVGGQIGQLGGPVNLPVSPVICDKARCACVADILITKTRLDPI